MRSSFEPSSASSACATMSLPANSAGVLARIRATSSATLPMPITTAVLPDRSGSSPANCGWPLYQPTNAALPNTLPRSSPGMPSGRSRGAPVARTTASYSSRSSAIDTSSPIATLPTKRTLSDSATFSKRFETALIDWWSGATPVRIRP